MGDGGRRWLMLALGVAAQAAGCAFVYGAPYLADVLRARQGLTLAQTGLLAACPTLGLLLAQAAWGYVVDRWGERLALAVGLGGSALVLLACWLPIGLAWTGVVFALAGAAGASVNSASGRVVLGWFPAERRGLAMGVRQTSTPLGMVVAALGVPPVAAGYGIRGMALGCAGLAALVAVACWLLVLDPPRATVVGAAGGSPYRDPLLWRVHGTSALLVVPQFAVAGYGYLYLADAADWDPVSAGRLMAVGLGLGALARIAVGRWSDALASRLRPLRWVAAATAVGVGALAASASGAGRLPGLAVALLVVAVVLTASGNGLAFTAVAELAGPGWAGRALGVHNTGQNLVGFAVFPLVGVVVGAASYGVAFAVAAGCAAVAVRMVPTGIR